MTTQYKIQYVHGRRPAGVDEGDLPWEDCSDEKDLDYGNLFAVVCRTISLDDAYDGKFTHRVADRDPKEKTNGS